MLDLGNQVLRLADDFRVDVDRSVGELRVAFGHDAVLALTAARAGLAEPPAFGTLVGRPVE